MIAKNIAPGLKRRFAFENLWLVQWEMAENERALARTKTFEWKYNIFVSDIDPEMIKMAKRNALRAWLNEDDIDFQVIEFKEYLWKELSGTLVSNPPYGERLKDENLASIYKSIDKLFRINPKLKWGVITSFLEFDGLISLSDYKKRKLYNGGEMCYFYKRK